MSRRSGRDLVWFVGILLYIVSTQCKACSNSSCQNWLVMIHANQKCVLRTLIHGFMRKITNKSNSLSSHLHRQVLRWKQYDRLIVPLLHMQFRTSPNKPRLSEGRKSHPRGNQKYVCHIQQPLCRRVTRTGLFSGFLSTCWLYSFLLTSSRKHQPDNGLFSFSNAYDTRKYMTNEAISRMTQLVLPCLPDDTFLFITLQRLVNVPKKKKHHCRNVSSYEMFLVI